jgi:hypothetical protein
MNKVEEIKNEISELYAKLKNIQSECSHPSDCITKKHGSDTGNWDRNEDCYWTDFHCSLCDKKWTEDGSH